MLCKGVKNNCSEKLVAIKQIECSFMACMTFYFIVNVYPLHDNFMSPSYVLYVDMHLPPLQLVSNLLQPLTGENVQIQYKIVDNQNERKKQKK